MRVANSGSSKTYTYGWQRAETLGALVNGVFLVALCLSIFLEAIQRFVEPQIVTNPKLVLIVGCLGLASNILGLFLFHDHGHSHGGAEESHSHSADPISTAEQGHSHAYEDEATRQVQDQTGSIADVLPQVKVAGYKPTRKSGDFSKSDEDTTTLGTNTTAPTRRTTVSSPEATSRHRRRTSGSFGRGFGSVDSINIHPASFRNDIIQAARLEERPESESESGEEEALLEEDGSPNENSRILSNANGTSSPKKDGYTTYGSIAKRRSAARSHSHDNHNHSQPKDSSQSHGGHGHSHGDLNMRGVFLHVLGDALGNIGVIASALIIWLTTFKGRYYFDPGISLVITVIILWSAIPLCKAASRILLQAVPVGMSIDEIRHDIEALDSVLEAHHLHVWQLSDTKLVASLHVKVDCEVEGSGSGSYMHLAREIRRCLHGYGIHSSTIQPEFTTGTQEAAIVEATDETGAISPGTGLGGNNSKAGSLMEGGRCLLDCEDECGSDSVCCPPQSNPTGSVDGNGNGNGNGKGK